MDKKAAASAPEVRPRGRRLKWRRSQMRAMAVGGVVCVCSVLLAMLAVYLQGKQTIVLQRTTRTTHATVTRRWTSVVARKTQYWVSYRYPELPANHADARKQVSPLWWSAMSPGTTIAIQFTPADPDVNGLSGNQSHLFSRWLWTCGVFGVVVVSTPFWLYLGSILRKRRELRLLKIGTPATAELTDVIETMEMHGRRQMWQYDVSYRFTLPDGSFYTGERHEASAEELPWRVGQVMTVFYDAARPERHALYVDLPAELVSSVQ